MCVCVGGSAASVGGVTAVSSSLSSAGKGDGETEASVPAVPSAQPRGCRDGAADDQRLQRCQLHTHLQVLLTTEDAATPQ